MPLPLASVPPVLLKVTLLTVAVLLPFTSSVPVLLKVPVPELSEIMSPSRNTPALFTTALSFTRTLLPPIEVVTVPLLLNVRPLSA